VITLVRPVITLMLILTLKPDPYANPNHNPYPNKPTEPYQTILILTDTVVIDILAQSACIALYYRCVVYHAVSLRYSKAIQQG